MPRRGVALVRVSRVGGRDDLLSPDLQRRAINEYAERNQITVTSWVEVLDESASRSSSRWWTTLDRVCEHVEQGQYDAVLVWKYSRAARHRRRWAVALDRIEMAGATLESATEGLDTRTATGRLARGMLAELNAWESEVRGEQWKETHAYRLAQGLPATGRPRFGYVYDGRGFAPDPVTGPLLAECYERYVSGWSGQRLADWLAREGVRTSRGNVWTATTVMRMLDTGFGAGLLVVEGGGRFLPGAHEPVISVALWETYRQRRAERKTVPPRIVGAKYELTGLLRCGHCKSSISPRIPGREWECSGSRRGECKPAVRVGERRALRFIRDWIVSVGEGRDADLIRWQREAARPAKNETALRKQLANAERRLLDLARKNNDGFYDDQTYLALRDEVTRERDEATKILAQRPAPVDLEPFQSLAQAWDGWENDPLLRRDATLTVLRWVWVYRDSSASDTRNRSRLVPVPRWVVV